MSEIAILVIEDEREVLEALVRDLEKFQEFFRIEPAENAGDASEVISELGDEDISVGLILADHLMPGMSGVDFLVSLHDDAVAGDAKKVLVTAQAGLEETVKAVNDADLDHYIRKPWSEEELHKTVVRYLTDYILEHSDNPLEFIPILDGERILSEYSRSQGLSPS